MDKCNIPIFKVYKESIKDTSYDKKNKEYMSESELKVINFDKVTKRYCEDKGKKVVPKSVDSLIYEDKKSIFIEFKNGVLDDEDIDDIINKIKDSLLIYCDIVETRISETRYSLDFILVYNKEKCIVETNIKKKTKKRKKYVSEYKIREEFNIKGVKFKLNRYKGLYFKEFHVYTKERFDDYINKIFTDDK